MAAEKIPDGYKLVMNGIVEAGDLVLFADGTWREVYVMWIGREIKTWWVARREKR